MCLRHSLVFHFKTMTAGYGDVCLLQVTSSHIFSSTFIQSFHSIFQITNAISFRIASFCGLSFVQFSCSQTRFFCLSGVMHRREHHIFSLNRRKYTNKNLSTIKRMLGHHSIPEVILDVSFGKNTELYDADSILMK